MARLCEWLTKQGFDSLFLDFDPERGFAAGAKWEAELYAQLRRADAVLFVGSAASVASQWCFAELTMTRSLGKTIIPAVISVGGSHPLLADTQTVDLTGADEHGYERLRQRLTAAELDPERTFDWDPARSPFPGLESFQERDAAVFFGRQVETERLLAQMRSSRRRYTGRLIAVVGPSGSGKSSLVRAGLLPRLRQAQRPWVVLSVPRPADRPLHQLAVAFVDAFRDGGAPRSLQSIELALREGGAGLIGLAEQLGHLCPGEPKPPALVFVDQAEELIATAAGEEHGEFLALLHGATRGAGSVWSLMTLRSEFLSAFLQEARGEFAFDDQLLVGPLEGARLAEVIERPADRAGVSFAAGLVGRMVADTGGGDALPLLAHTLASLYERVRVRGRRGATISIGDYEDLGGVVGALRRSADEEHARLSERGLGGLVLPTLRRLVTVGPEGQPTRRRLARAALSHRENEIAEAFIDARLLTSMELDGASVVEVAHEALLRQWPPLAEAIERDREGLQLRSELERAAEDWERSGRHEEYLLPVERLAAGGRLNRSSSWAATDLTGIAQRFLTASRDRKVRREAAQRRRARRAFASLVAALIVVTSLAFIALIQGGRARDQRDTAQATLLATNAAAELATDPGQSLVFGMEAYAKKPTSLAEGALRVAASQAPRQLILRSGQEFDYSSGFASDGRHLASSGDDGTVRVWDSRGPRIPPTVLGGLEPFDSGVAFAGDGRHVAIASASEVQVRDWRTPRISPIVLRGGREPVHGVAFAHDGRHVASAGQDGMVRVWNWRAPRTPPIVLRSQHVIVEAVAFADDGRHLASAGDDQTVQVWNWRKPHTPPTVLRGHQSFVSTVAFADDGRHLASAGGDGTVRVWDWRKPHMPATVLRGHRGTINAVAFADDGRHVASAGDDGTVRVWDWRTPNTPAIVLRGHQRPVFGVAFLAGAHDVASAGEDGTVRVWDWRPLRNPVTVLGGHQRRVFGVAFVGGGRDLASAGEDGTVRVWDWRTPRTQPTVLGSHDGTVNVRAFAGYGNHLASVGHDGRVRVWDRRAPSARPTVLRGRHGTIGTMAFASDERHLATADEFGLVQVWDWHASGTRPSVLPDSDGTTVDEVAFADDGRHLATARADRTVRVWNWRAPGARPTAILRGHQGFVARWRSPTMDATSPAPERTRRCGCGTGAPHILHPSFYAATTGPSTRWRSRTMDATSPAPETTEPCGCGTGAPHAFPRLSYAAITGASTRWRSRTMDATSPAPETTERCGCGTVSAVATLRPCSCLPARVCREKSAMVDHSEAPWPAPSIQRCRHLTSLLAIVGAHDATYGPREVLGIVRRELQVIDGDRQAARGDLRSDLMRVEARWTIYAAWLCEDTGDRRGRAALLERAVQLAREADHPDLMAWARARQAQWTDPPRAIRLAEAALRTRVLARTHARCAPYAPHMPTHASPTRTRPCRRSAHAGRAAERRAAVARGHAAFGISRALLGSALLGAAGARQRRGTVRRPPARLATRARKTRRQPLPGPVGDRLRRVRPARPCEGRRPQGADDCARDAERDRGPRASPATTSCASDATRTERRSDRTWASITAHSRARDSTSRCPARTATGRFRCRSRRRNRLFAVAPAPFRASPLGPPRKPSTTLRFRT
ncbi:MAG: hypothetical protein QOI48_638 [Solirubrobacteraceae bacterium]|nr:hypothetical protein [Solirubrobacteraceae bacterium]